MDASTLAPARRTALATLFVSLALAFASRAAQPTLLWTVPDHFCGSPVWSPDGRLVACADGSIYDHGRKIARIDGHNAFWSPDSAKVGTTSKDFLFGVTIWDARTGRLLGAVPANAAEHAVWSPDGKSILFSGYFEKTSIAAVDALDLWPRERLQALLIKCASNPSSCYAKEVPAPRTIAEGHRPAISRDGHLAYLFYRGKGNELWLRRAGRTTSERVPVEASGFWRTEWSPDGRWLAINPACQGKACVDVLDLRHPERGFRHLAEDVGWFGWSPDSSGLAVYRRIDNRKRLGINLDRFAIAKVALTDARMEMLLEPGGEWCTYDAVAWSSGGLLATHRCYPEGAPAGGQNEMQVYEVR